MSLPEEYLEAPVDYAIYRYFLKRGDTNKAGEFKSLYDTAVELAQDAYGVQTSSQVISAEPQFRTYNNWRGDALPPGSIT